MKIKRIPSNVYRKFADTEMKLFFEDFFGRAKGKDYYKTYSFKEKKFFFSVVKGKEIVGVVNLRIHRLVANIGAFVVKRNHREKGIGSLLLKKCEETAKKYKCKKIWLWTLPTIKAYKFYKKHGYKEEARLKNHFGGNDLCIMGKFL